MDSNKTTITFEIGTAFELFISLIVLHEPDKYGLRASWAAGIRSRIPAPERKFLEEFVPFLDLPFSWVESLPEPRDAIAVLWALRQVPPADRMITLAGITDCEKPLCQLTRRVTANRAWTPEDLDLLMAEFGKNGLSAPPYDRDSLTTYLNWLARPAELGEMLLSSLQAYHQAFFEEEEKRLAPVLQAGLERARELARTHGPVELLTELSQGIHDEDIIKHPELIFVPAFWTTPLMVFVPLSDQRLLLCFGARPDDMPAIPGEAVPDGLVRTLKALADPTRLKILHYLSAEELSPSELARRLRLRAPTVTHHLNELRLAGLVNLIIKGSDRLYSARREALPGTFVTLSGFLDQSASQLSDTLDAEMAKVEEKLDNL